MRQVMTFHTLHCFLVSFLFFMISFLPAAVSAQETAPVTEAADQSLFADDPFAEDQEEISVADPLEPFNRSMFWVNDKLYFYLFKPVARAYRIVPEPPRESVGRAFANLGTPVRFANSVLQLKMKEAGTELSRFVINSTLGFFGFFDPAQQMGLKQHDEDFGQTLGHYGTGTGFYLVLPVLGPSNLRDGVGQFVDGLADPITSPYYVKIKQFEEIGLKTYDRINWLSLDEDTYESIKRDALDPYLFVRGAYLQRRAAQVEK